MEKGTDKRAHDIISPTLNRGYYMQVGQRIKQLRKDMKLTQDVFASKLKIHPKQLAKYEAGRSKPSIDAVARIARFCEISADSLIFDEDKTFIKRTKIADTELLEYFRRVNKLKKADRDKIKWAIKSLLNGE